MLTGAGVALVMPQNQALFLKRGPGGDEPGTWCLPGGTIEPGEPPEIAAIRELREETDYIAPEDAAPLQRVTAVTGPYAIFKRRINSEFIPTLDHEHTAWAWAPLSDPPQPLHPKLAKQIPAIIAGDGVVDMQPMLATVPNSGVPGATTASKRKPALDMTSSDWTILARVLGKFLGEEAAEAEHAEDAGREAEHTAIIKYNGDFNLKGLLNHLRELGRVGASRDVIAMSADDKPVKFDWDGDGADKIVSVEIDGNALAEDDNDKLSDRDKTAIGAVGSEKREEEPSSVFLEPGSRKYPVKEKRDGEWKYDRKLLVAAARRARMNGNETLAGRADAIRKREFAGAVDQAPAWGGDLAMLPVNASHDGPWMSCMAKDGHCMYRNKNVPEFADIKGRHVVVDDMLKFHEGNEYLELVDLVEQFIQKNGRDPNTAERIALYLKAHNDAGTPAERAHARRIGLDWDAWLAWCRGMEARVEKGPFDSEPADADVKPIDHHHDLAEALDWDGAIDAAFDTLEILALDDADTVRSIDKDGRMHVGVTNISKANICPYRGEEIPGWQELGLEKDKVYRLLRDPDELRRAAPTFNGIQLLKRHVPVNADDHRMWDIVGTTGSDTKFNEPYLQTSLHVWTQDGIDLIESERQKELSSGYHYKPDMTPGTFEGEHYDGVMRDIVGNHVALVKDGRAGPDVVVGDDARAMQWQAIASVMVAQLLRKVAA